MYIYFFLYYCDIHNHFKNPEVGCDMLRKISHKWPMVYAQHATASGCVIGGKVIVFFN
jgi:hypothetical protein